MCFKFKLEPLELALKKIDEAIEIAYKYKRNKKYIPTVDDLLLFSQLETRLFTSQATLSYIYRCMNQRFKGEAEGAKKFTDPNTSEWHSDNKLK